MERDDLARLSKEELFEAYLEFKNGERDRGKYEKLGSARQTALELGALPGLVMHVVNRIQHAERSSLYQIISPQ